jgi:hypothetical protein
LKNSQRENAIFFQNFQENFFRVSSGGIYIECKPEISAQISVFTLPILNGNQSGFAARLALARTVSQSTAQA